MATIKYERGSVTNVLTTELNSLANNGKVLSAEIDNSTALDFFDDLVLSTAAFGAAPSAGAICELYILEALDDTNFVDGDSTVDPAQSDPTVRRC